MGKTFTDSETVPFRQREERRPDLETHKVQKFRDIALFRPMGAEASSLSLDTFKMIPMKWVDEFMALEESQDSVPYVVDCLTDQDISHGYDWHEEGSNQVGLRFPRGERDVINVDHHSAIREMQGKVSTYSFLVKVKNWYGQENPEKRSIMITHTDADSALSAMRLQDLIPPEFDEECLEAVLATDHTGAQTDLGDLISAAQVANDIELTVSLVLSYFQEKLELGDSFSFGAFLNTLREQGKSVRDGEVELLVADNVVKYREKRESASRVFDVDALALSKCQIYDELQSTGGLFLTTATNGWDLWYFGEGVFWINNEADGERAYFDNELLSYLLPPGLRDLGTVILFSRQMPEMETKDTRGKFEVKVRVVPDHVGTINLQEYGINLPPYGVGCRHNAGSSFRDGGTSAHGREVAAKIAYELRVLGIKAGKQL